jgi:DtxR family Mn-dependent transcriptional regulator
MNNMSQRLTPSQENYLENILHLAAKGSVRPVDLAVSVGVKLPSVTRAVNKLALQGLVQHKHYGTIELTPKGRLAARRIVKRDKCITDFLTHVLKMNPDKAEAEACRIEHVLSNEVQIRLQVLIDFFGREADVNQKLHRAIEVVNKSSPAEGTVIVGRTKPHA